MTPVVVLTTVGLTFDVAPLARELVTQHLAACVNVIERIRSFYGWKGALEDESEQLLIIKTVEEKVPALQEALLARHPYEVPEFVVIRMDELSRPYRDWLIASVYPE